FGEAFRFARAGGSLRREPPGNRGREGPCRTARLRQRVRRGGQGVRAGARRHRARGRAGNRGGPPRKPREQTQPGGSTDRTLERDDFSSNCHPALAYWWSMIFSENWCPVFGIMR